MFENNDRIKAFKSKILLTDAVHERDAQLNFKDNYKILDSMRDEMYKEELEYQ